MTKTKKEFLSIHYQKNPLYRSIYADGAIGGSTPKGKLNLNFYSTRHTIPREIEYEFDIDGKISNLESKIVDGKNGLVREIEVSLYIDRDTAVDLLEFLKMYVENEHEI